MITYIIKGPMLIGPIIAPLIGGAVSNFYGWRATFLVLIVITVPIILFAYFILPETHHYFATDKEVSKEEMNTMISRSLKKENTDNENNDQNIVDKSKDYQLANVDEPTQEQPVDVESNADVVVNNDKEESTIIKIINFIHEKESIVLQDLMMPWEPLVFILEPQLMSYYLSSGISFAV